MSMTQYSLAIVSVLVIANIGVLEADHQGRCFFGWTTLAGWERTETETQTVYESPVVKCGFGFRELVLSWNASAGNGTGLKFEARGFPSGRPTRYYVMGLWTELPGAFARKSVNHQTDDDGEVQTDTLSLRKPSERFQLRVTSCRSERSNWPEIRFIGTAVCDPTAQMRQLEPVRAAWNRLLDVPCRSQVDYPEGINAWCSPACVSMVLAYWARVTNRPELDHDVPTVARAVYDPTWKGTGNWSFNVAYAGSFSKMRAYVTRLSDIAEIEAWVLQGVPVVASVSYDLLRGRPKTHNTGHLIVCVGFTGNGDVVVNDPGTRKEMRRTILRENFAKAWDYSRRTVYLIYPEDIRPPTDMFGHWFTTR